MNVFRLSSNLSRLVSMHILNATHDINHMYTCTMTCHSRDTPATVLQTSGLTCWCELWTPEHRYSSSHKPVKSKHTLYQGHLALQVTILAAILREIMVKKISLGTEPISATQCMSSSYAHLLSNTCTCLLLRGKGFTRFREKTWVSGRCWEILCMWWKWERERRLDTHK